MLTRWVERWNALLVGSPGLSKLRAKERATARRLRFIYKDSGKIRVIDLKLRPRLMGKAQLSYLSAVARDVGRVQRRVAARWWADEALQRALPVTEAERAFFAPVLSQRAALAAPVVARLDASVAFARPGWKEKLKLFELNSVGVGGLALTPIAQEVIREVCVPALGKDGPALAAGPDTREGLFDVLKAQARALRLDRPVFALVEERDDDSGTAEYDDLSRRFTAWGVPTRIGDVRDLEVRGDRLLLGGRPVDLLYRDTEVKDVVARGWPATARAALQWALARGRVVSGIAGDFDHKSLWEVLTSTEFSRYLSGPQRARLRQHALWTRLVYPRRTADERDRSVDLAEHLRRHRERYVLKPNRSYGGVGVTVGIDTSPRAWDAALQRALSRPSTWVAQQLGEVMEEDFPIVGARGEATLVPHFVDCGVYCVGDTYGILSRAAYRRVVNVSSGGGLAVVLFA